MISGPLGSWMTVNMTILGWHVVFLEFGISCKAIIEDGIMYDQIVKGTIIEIGVYAF